MGCSGSLSTFGTGALAGGCGAGVNGIAGLALTGAALPGDSG